MGKKNKTDQELAKPVEVVVKVGRHQVRVRDYGDGVATASGGSYWGDAPDQAAEDRLVASEYALSIVRNGSLKHSQAKTNKENAKRSRSKSPTLAELLAYRDSSAQYRAGLVEWKQFAAKEFGVTLQTINNRLREASKRSEK